MIESRNRTFSLLRLRVLSRGNRRRAIRVLTAGALLLATLGARAAERPQFRHSVPPPILDGPTSRRSAPTGTEGVTTLPRNAFQTERVGVPYATLFRNTRLPVGSPVTLPPLEPSMRTESVKARFRVNLPQVSAGLPFLQRGFEPTDADLKVGPFYFKLVAIQGAVLYSDNIYLDPDNERESGTIAITSATVSVLAQLTESLRIAATGSLVYLPIEGKAGIAGFGITDLYSIGLFVGPAAQAQVAWETQIGGWTVIFADDFQVLLGVYSSNVRSDYVLFEGGGFNEESRAGRYIFRPQGQTFENKDRDDFEREFNEDFVVFSNVISATVDRLVPGPVRLSARVYREDLWYNQGNRGLPRLREGAFARAASERVNMRFKPFVSYEAFRADYDNSFDDSFNNSFQQIVRFGIDGPITDQLQFHADAGYYFGVGDRGGYLWRLSLRHTVGPFTYQSLYYGRNFSDFQDEIIQAVGYNLRQVLGPRLSADLYAFHANFESPGNQDDDDDFTRNETRAGLRMTLIAGPKTVVRGSVTYAAIDPNSIETWTGRFEIGYNFTDTLLGRFLYQYQQTNSDLASLDYTENLVFVSLTKFFP